MRAPFADSARGYIIALLSTVAATWGRIQLEPLVVGRVPFALYFASVLVTAWLGGTTPAMVALVLGVLSAAHWIIPPHDSLAMEHPADKVSLLVYTGVSAASIWLFHRSATEHRAAEHKAKENEELSARLKYSDRKKDEFLALLAHELRNPLAPIRTGLEVLDRGKVDVLRQSQIRRTMNRQLDQLVRIVDDLLDVSRFIKGRMRLQYETVDLREVVDAALETCQPVLDHHEHLVQFVKPKVPVHVHADRLRLAQVVSNLLTNAAKYTPRRGRIRILVESNSTGTSLHVQDNGIGVPHESQSQIFDLFSQVNPSETRDHGGLGLGLSIVRQLTELHGGNASVFSEGPGRGSRFTITLPAISLPVPQETVCIMADTDTKISIPRPGIQVLVVDDNEDAADTLAALLSFEGYAPHVAHDGPTALAKFDEHAPQIILLDIGMPGMDGYQVARELRSREEGRSARIIALTGWGSESDRERTKNTGFDDHLVKPVEFDQLIHLLENQQPATKP